MRTIKLINSATATGAGVKVEGVSTKKTYQASGRTSAGSGAVTVAVQGSNNGGASWDTIATFTLALTATAGVGDASDSFTSDDRYAELRANVTALSGTNAQVSCVVGY